MPFFCAVSAATMWSSDLRRESLLFLVIPGARLRAQPVGDGEAQQAAQVPVSQGVDAGPNMGERPSRGEADGEERAGARGPLRGGLKGRP